MRLEYRLHPKCINVAESLQNGTTTDISKSTEKPTTITQTPTKETTILNSVEVTESSTSSTASTQRGSKFVRNIYVVTANHKFLLVSKI